MTILHNHRPQVNPDALATRTREFVEMTRKQSEGHSGGVQKTAQVIVCDFDGGIGGCYRQNFIYIYDRWLPLP